MKRALLHEEHNRQDKTWQERGTGGAWGGSEGKPSRPVEKEFRLTEDPTTGRLRITLTTVYHQKIAEQQLREDLSIALRRHLTSKTFIISGCRFHFNFNLNTFAQANGLPPEKAKARFQAVKQAAKDKLAMVFRRFHKTTLKYAPDGTPYIPVAWEQLLPPA